MYLYIETLKQRLDAINQLRVDRALAAMGPAFQQVYSLLPTLLHYHHPLMPGYLDGNVPKGICLYTPDETQRHYLNELELYRGMSVQDPPKGELPITGVYTMGSTSSVGQSCSSDLDIWVCHQSWLDSEERQLLQRKCSLLENWAASLGVEVSFFLIDENRFLQSDLSGLLMELLQWGCSDPAQMSWLDQPPVVNLMAAKRLLHHRLLMPSVFHEAQLIQ